MHERAFSKAVLPEPKRVLLLWLKPYSIGHELILTARGNPFVLYNEQSFLELPANRQRFSLIEAALVCYRNWRENKKAHRSWDLRLWGFVNNERLGIRLPSEVKNFFDYRAAGAEDFPAVRMPQSAGANFHYFGSPEASRLLLFVQGIYKDFGFETPYDFPYALARQLYSTKLESEGNLWIENWQDVETKERLRAYEKLHPESGLAIGDEAVRKSAEAWNKEHPDNPVPIN